MVTVASALNELPVPVGSTRAVLMAREPSAPGLKFVAVRVKLPSAASGAAVLDAMVDAMSVLPHGVFFLGR